MSRLLSARRKPLVHPGTSNPELAGRVADRLGVRLGGVEYETFSNGEATSRFDQSIRGADVLLVRSCSPQLRDRSTVRLRHEDRPAIAARIREPR